MGGFPLPTRTLKGSFYSAYKNDVTQYKWPMFTIRPVYILFDQWWAINVWRPFYMHYNKLPLEEAVSVDKVIYRFELNLKMKIDINFKFEAPCWCWFAVQMERDLLKLIHSKYTRIVTSIENIAFKYIFAAKLFCKCYLLVHYAF